MNSERGALISGNWKMHENHFEALKLVQELAALMRSGAMSQHLVVSIHPPFTSLRTVQVAIETDRLALVLGAQNCHFEQRGAYTGEVSAEMLAKLSVRYVIVGHSERRRLQGETDEIVRAKLDAVLGQAMIPILCVGEDAEQREAGEAQAVVVGQLRAALGGRSEQVVSAAVLAYEPLWAIGSGVVASPADAQEMCAVIRSELVAMVGPSGAAARIQYGGSVSPENAQQLLAQDDVDGLLVGGASLDAARFLAIVRAGVDQL